MAIALASGACSSLGLGDKEPADAKTREIDWSAASNAELREENAALKSEVAALQQRLAALEADGAAAVAALDVPEEPATEPGVDEAAADSLTIPVIEPAVAPARPPAPKDDAVVAAAQADQALADAPAPAGGSPRLLQPSFADDRPVFDNEAPAEAGGQAARLFGVHLASYKIVDEAREGWRTLQRENPEELGLLEPRIERIRVEGRGEFLRLVGGGFASEATASALCARLNAKGVYCATASFNGERLTFNKARG
ncbi:MAG: hypothetical protein AAGC56_05290 [Pseudomonadota bacterium]